MAAPSGAFRRLGNGVLQVATCTGPWLLDLRQSRYCRVPSGTPTSFLSPRAWVPFRKLVVGSTGVVRVVLDDEGTATVSGWVHTDDCVRCAQAGASRPA